MIVSNSSVLLALSVIGQLPILQKMWTRVCVPSAVWEEVVVTGKGEPGASTVENAGWIVVQEVQNTLLAHALQESLDRGEAEAIVLALEQHSSIILLDEKQQGNGQHILVSVRWGHLAYSFGGLRMVISLN